MRETILTPSEQAAVLAMDQIFGRGVQSAHKMLETDVGAKIMYDCAIKALVAVYSTQNDLENSLADQVKRLQEERYRLALAITGGEDYPGYVDSLSVETLVDVAQQNKVMFIADVDRAEAKVLKLRKALDEIVAGPDCGCSPTCRCKEGESALELIIEWLREVASDALKETDQ